MSCQNCQCPSCQQINSQMQIQSKIAQAQMAQNIQAAQWARQMYQVIQGGTQDAQVVQGVQGPSATSFDKDITGKIDGQPVAVARFTRTDPPKSRAEIETSILERLDNLEQELFNLKKAK